MQRDKAMNGGKARSNHGNWYRASVGLISVRGGRSLGLQGAVRQANKSDTGYIPFGSPRHYAASVFRWT